MTSAEQANATGRPCEWRANGLNLRGLSWGDPAGRPLLALHGWLDNAASFVRLAPLLLDHHVVALDLSGHGQSDRRSADASYHIYDDLPEIISVLQQLGWERFDLIGHSRGAIIATLLAAAFPERVKALVMLDAIAPEPVAEERFAEQLRRGLLDKPHFLGRGNTEFATQEDAVASRERRGLGHYAARELSVRNLRPCDAGYTWTTDPRLHSASAVKMTRVQIAAVLQSLTMPVLLMLAESDAREKSNWMHSIAHEHINNVTVESVDGGHHFHMEEGVGMVAQLVADFLNDAQVESSQ